MSANLDIYGPVADRAAIANGIDPAVFRSLIMSESSFDPYAINPQAVGNEHASGIAQFLPSTAASRGVDPFNPYDALNGAASYLAELMGKYGLAGAIAKYKGYSDKNMTSGLQTAQAIIDGANAMNPVTAAAQAGGEALKNAVMGGSTVAGDKPFWQYDYTDFQGAIKAGALSFVLGLVGVVLIVLSIWAIFNRSKAAVVNVAGKVAG